MNSPFSRAVCACGLITEDSASSTCSFFGNVVFSATASSSFGCVAIGFSDISEAYHKAKADGSNPELVKAVEELLTPKENAIQEQEASSVPIQPKAEGSQEVQGTQPESGPKEVADKGEKEVLIPKEFKPSVESKKAAKAFVELSNSEASAPSIKERKQAKIQEAIEEVRKSDPAKADKMQEVFDRMPEIQQTLLEKGIIKAIDCKWG